MGAVHPHLLLKLRTDKLHTIYTHLEDEVKSQNERITRDEQILKKVLQHEIDSTKIIRELQSIANNTYRYEILAAAISGASNADAQYFSRRLWRVRKIKEFLEEVDDITSAMYTKEVSHTLSAAILQSMGIFEPAKVNLHTMSLTNNTVTVTFQTVTGDKVTGTISHRQNYSIISAPDRMYMVRADFTLGMPIGVRQTRINGPINEDCGQIVHKIGDRYTAITSGVLKCKSIAATQNEHNRTLHFNSSTEIRIHSTEDCYNDCISVRKKGYKTQLES